MNFQSTFLINWIGMSFILRIQRLKIYVGVYNVLVSILNLQLRCLNLATSLVQR